MIKNLPATRKAISSDIDRLRQVSQSICIRKSQWYPFYISLVLEVSERMRGLSHPSEKRKARVEI